MQLVCRFDSIDWDDWKAQFDDDTEDRRLAGLTVLQLWRDVDTPGAAVALFEVNDRGKAQAWLDRQAGFGATVRSDFLRTA